MKKFAIILDTTTKLLFVPIMAAGTGSTKNNIIVERGDLRMFQATTAATALDAPDGRNQDKNLVNKKYSGY